MLLFLPQKKGRIVARERLSLFAISELERLSEIQDLMRSISDCLRFFSYCHDWVFPTTDENYYQRYLNKNCSC